MAFTPKRVIMVLLLSLLAAALVVAIMVALGEYTKTRGRFLATALSLSGFSLLVLPPSLLAQRARAGYWGYAGLGIAGLAYLLLAGGLWGTPNSDAYWKAVAIATIGAASLSQLSWLLLMTPKVFLARIVWLIAATAVGLVLALASLAIIVEIKTAPFWWAVAIIVVVQVVAGIAAHILNRWPSHS